MPKNRHVASGRTGARILKDHMAKTKPIAGKRTIAELREWHALAPEDPVDSDLPIIDAHHHLWNRPPQAYQTDAFFDDISLSGHNVRATCFVECTSMYKQHGPEHLRPIGETEYVNGMAAMSASGFYGPLRMCAAITGYADLRRADIAEILLAHVAAGGGRFRGVRQQAQFDPALGSLAKRPTPEGLLRDPAFRRGLAVLGAMDLVFDAVVYFTQLGDLASAARGCPDTAIVLNHVGWPMAIGPYADQQATFSRWREGMAELEKCPNVSVKLGGLGMTAFGFGFEHWPAPPSSEQLLATWRPYLETMISLFGAGRCMFESNFPVDAQSCSYASLWNAFKLLTHRATHEERHLLFAGAARKIYRLNELESHRRTAA